MCWNWASRRAAAHVQDQRTSPPRLSDAGARSRSEAAARNHRARRGRHLPAFPADAAGHDPDQRKARRLRKRHDPRLLQGRPPARSRQRQRPSPGQPRAPANLAGGARRQPRPTPPRYLIIIHYSGDHTLKPASTSRRSGWRANAPDSDRNAATPATPIPTSRRPERPGSRTSPTDRRRARPPSAAETRESRWRSRRADIEAHRATSIQHSPPVVGIPAPSQRGPTRQARRVPCARRRPRRYNSRREAVAQPPTGLWLPAAHSRLADQWLSASPSSPRGQC
jgi:hypothetical protein